MSADNGAIHTQITRKQHLNMHERAHVLVYLIAAGIISCDIKDTLFRMFLDVADKMLNGEW